MTTNKTNKCEGCEPKAFGEIKSHRWDVCHQQPEKEEKKKEDHIICKKVPEAGICCDCSNCSCHPIYPEKEKVWYDISSERKKAVEDYMDKQLAHPEPSESWEKELEKYKEILDTIRNYPMYWNIKELIKRTLLSERTALVEELKAICNKTKTERGLATALANFIKKKEVKN